MKEGKTDMTDVVQKSIWALPSHFQDMAGGYVVSNFMKHS